uniref:Uncharacterized protein n=1 Tax=Cajanus cajan TaxID=3821 RepID=A0A151RS53_CAJCA|nr:hypothetical protein KK1_033087 [Cajanus cajan]
MYTRTQFRRRFRMRKHVFLRIITTLTNHDEYFRTRIDATRRRGLSPLQKCTAALRILAYGSPADSVDEYILIGENTVVECLQRFFWDAHTMKNIIYACIILHSMIVED